MRISSNRAELFDALADQTLPMKPGATCVLEKNPGYAHILEYILSAFSQAKILFCVREPSAAFVSLQGSVALPSVTPESYVRLWKAIATKRVTAQSERVITVRYEELAITCEKTRGVFCTFLDLGFAETLLAPARHADNAPSYLRRGDHDRIGAVITPKSIGRWREALSEANARIIAGGCGIAMRRFGYEP